MKCSSYLSISKLSIRTFSGFRYAFVLSVVAFCALSLGQVSSPVGGGSTGDWDISFDVAGTVKTKFRQANDKVFQENGVSWIGHINYQAKLWSRPEQEAIQEWSSGLEDASIQMGVAAVALSGLPVISAAVAATASGLSFAAGYFEQQPIVFNLANRDIGPEFVDPSHADLWESSQALFDWRVETISGLWTQGHTLHLYGDNGYRCRSYGAKHVGASSECNKSFDRKTWR